jgi:cytoskeleton protein RodZ
MAVERTSGGFGGRLRDARERRGISLRQIANATKISVGALEALERNDVSRLPGGIFSRAFVRSYAAEVGLDPDATIQEFIAQFPNDSAIAGHAGRDQEDHVAIESDRRTAGTFVWLIVLSLPIAAVLVYFATAGRRAQPQAIAAIPGDAKEPISAAAPSEPAPTPPPAATQAAQPAAAVSPTEPAATPADNPLVVRLAVRRPCYISATVDGEKRIDRLLQPGEEETIDVRREMVVTAGDASAITLTLNGAEARPLGRSGEVVTVRFNPANYRDYLQVRR